MQFGSENQIAKVSCEIFAPIIIIPKSVLNGLGKCGTQAVPCILRSLFECCARRIPGRFASGCIGAENGELSEFCV